MRKIANKIKTMALGGKEKPKKVGDHSTKTEESADVGSTQRSGDQPASNESETEPAGRKPDWKNPEHLVELVYDIGDGRYSEEQVRDLHAHIHNKKFVVNQDINITVTETLDKLIKDTINLLPDSALEEIVTECGQLCPPTVNIKVHAKQIVWDEDNLMSLYKRYLKYFKEDNSTEQEPAESNEPMDVSVEESSGAEESTPEKLQEEGDTACGSGDTEPAEAMDTDEPMDINDDHPAEDTIHQLIATLDSKNRKELVADYKKLTGKDTSQNKDWLKQHVKTLLILQLISQLEPGTIRTILIEMGQSPHRNNNKLLGQLKMEALKNETSLEALLKATDEKQIPVYLDTAVDTKTPQKTKKQAKVQNAQGDNLGAEKEVHNNMKVKQKTKKQAKVQNVQGAEKEVLNNMTVKQKTKKQANLTRKPTTKDKTPIESRNVEQLQGLIEKLDEMRRDRMVNLFEQLGKTKIDRNQKDDRIKKSFKNLLVTELISRLEFATMRQILRDICKQKPNPNNVSLPGQLKILAVNTEAVLTAVYDALTADEQEVNLYNLDAIVDLIGSVNATMPRQELDNLHMRLTKEEFDSNQTTKRLANVVRKKLAERFVSKIYDASSLIIEMGDWPEKENNEDKLRLQAINLIHKQGGDTKFLEKLKTYAIKIEKARAMAGINPAEDVSDGEEATSTTTRGADELQTMLVTRDVWEKFSTKQIQDYYQKLGHTPKRFPSKNNMIDTCRSKIVATVINQIPRQVVGWILKDCNIKIAKGHSENAALKKHCLTDAQVLETVASVYNDIKSGKTIDNINPTNRFIRERNQQKMQELRKEVLSSRNNGSCKIYPQNGQDNPIIQAGLEMEAELAKIKFEFCKICREKRGDSGINPKTRICRRCDREKPKENMPYMFSPENNMYPGPQPPELANLTLVEQVCIARAHTLLRVVNLKGGGSKIKGSSISFAQDVGDFYRKLPTRPEELPIVIVKSHNQNAQFRANRHRIKRALDWLVKNNKYYKGLVEISNENLSAYPDDDYSYVENLRSLQSEDDGDENPEVDQTTETHSALHINDDVNDNADDLADAEHHGEENTSDPAGTFVHHEIPTGRTKDNIEAALLLMKTKSAEKQSDSPQPVELELPTRDQNPLSEFRTEGFFTMCYPHLFPTGAGDVTAKSDQKVEVKDNLREFADHLFWVAIDEENNSEQSRFSADPRFAFHVVNMYQRHEALKLGTVMADRICEDKSVEEITAALENPSHSLTKCIKHLSGQIPGSDAFFAAHRKKANATERAMRIFTNNKERFNFFFTLSLADNHLDALHRLLPGREAYLDKIVVDELNEGDDPDRYITKKQDYLLRQKAVHNNGHIVDWFAHKRLELMREKILEPHLGMMDYIIRCEYQARSAIHFHMIGRCTGIDLQTLEDAFGPDYINGERNSKKEFSCSRVTEFGVEKLGISACHPEEDVKEMPPPMGLNFLPPNTNALRETLTDAASREGGLEQDLIHLTNRVLLHKCRPIYCYPSKTNSKGKKIPCRFRFPFKIFGFKKLSTIAEVDETTGEPTGEEYTPLERDTTTALSGAEINNTGDLQYLRNHPWIVEHIPELLSVWRGNIDAKVIKTQDTLINYLVKYVTKVEGTSLNYAEVLRQISESCPENEDEVNVKKAMQKILLSIVKEHDLGKNEAFKIISKKNHVFYSRPFVYVNLTDKRRLNVEACQAAEQEGKVKLTKNAADMYWMRDTDPKYKSACDRYDEDPTSMPTDPRCVSLNTYAALWTTGWQFTGDLKVPVPTPQYVYVPGKKKNPDAYQNYCEVTLLLHKPGSNSGNYLMKDFDNPDSEKFTDAEEALKDFVSDPESPCPEAVREEFLKALEEQSRQDKGGPAGDGEDNIELLVPDPVDGAEEDFEIGELEPGLFDCVMMDDDMTARDMEIEAAANEEPTFTKLTHNPNHDFHEDRREQISFTKSAELYNWIKETKESFVLADTGARPDVSTLNHNQRLVHDAAMRAMEDKQMFLDTCGAGGTGKSHTINAIIKSAKDKFGEEGKHVVVIAPTGAAASQFTGGKTIHSFLKLGVNRKKQKKELRQQRFAQLGETAAQDLERELADVRLIVIDEKSMVGRGMLEAIDRRLKQARPSAKDQPFGGISIMIAGDFRQLPPVGDSPLFLRGEDANTPEEASGGALYEKFDDNTFILTEQMRQRDPVFIAEMDSLGNNTFSNAAFERWDASMDLRYMSKERQRLFHETGTMLCARKADMGDFNEKGIQRLNKPIARSLAKHNCTQASKASPAEADNLYNELYLAKGAKVVLTKNLWSEAGLVNGSQGFIKHIIYDEGNPANASSMPDMLLVHFPGYKGPSCLGPEEEETVVPIFPVQAEWYNDRRKRLTRTQFPLLYGYAITIHKAQGELRVCLSMLIFNVTKTCDLF